MTLAIAVGIGLLAGGGAMFMWMRLRQPGVVSSLGSPAEAGARARNDVEELTRVLMSETEKTFVLFDADMRIVDINHLAEFPAGTTKRDLVGKHLTEISPAMGDAGWHHRLQTVIQTGKSVSGDEFLPNPRTGEKGRVSLTALRLGDRMGLLAHDITNEPRLDELLRWGEGRWESLVEAMPAQVVIVDEAGTIGFVNRTVTDAPRARALGKPFTAFLQPRFRETALEMLKSVLADGAGRQLEAEGFHFDGSSAWYDIRISRIEGPGANRSAIIIATDTTERKVADVKVQESEETYRTIFEVIPGGVIMADVESMKITYANRNACEMFGYSVEEFLELSVLDCHPRNRLDAVKASFISHAQGDLSAPVLPCVRKDGSLFQAEFRVAPAVLRGRQANIGFIAKVETGGGEEK